MDAARLQAWQMHARFAQALDPDHAEPSDEAARAGFHVYGDLYSRLHGVYTGTAGQVTDWYR